MQTRKVIKIGGESGQGVNSIGEMLCKSLKESGYFVFGYREYPSLIQGGYSNYQIDFSDKSIGSSSRYCDLAVGLSRVAVGLLLKDLNHEGILIHWIKGLRLDDEQKKRIEEKKLKVVYIEADKYVEELGGVRVMVNTLLTGLTWACLGEDTKILEEEFRKQFAKKPQILVKNLEIIDFGYKLFDEKKLEKLSFKFERNLNQNNSLLLTGNHALSLGAISAGVRAFYAYPMTPSSSILTYLANTYKESSMLVKQAEDEITAIQMTLGSSNMGTRSLVATSGGGFDLMTESVSMSAMNEIPLVCIVAQRPGPATGSPTWTCASDLNLAVYSAHGEFTRCVIAVSDIASCYLRIQEAYNISDKFQIPVIVLTEKQIAEALFNTDNLPAPIKINRCLVENFDEIEAKDRYKITENGISPRWLPGETDKVYNSNGDEHFGNGRLTEDALEIKTMQEKRMNKIKFLKNEIPEPELFGDEKGDVLIMGWGSTKNTVLDAMKEIDSHVSYLHYEYVFPVRTEKLVDLVKNFKRVILVESNYQGQLGDLIKLDCGFEFEEKLLKYDGRPLFVEDIVDGI